MARQRDRGAAPEPEAAEEYQPLEYIFTVRGKVQVGKRSYDLPLQVTVDTDTLAALVQQHLNQGNDLREALLEIYASAFEHQLMVEARQLLS